MRDTKKLYVTMTDRFMSGWGLADNKINKLVFECDNYSEANKLIDYAEKREEMKYISVCYSYPKHLFNNSKYFAQLKTKADYPMWYGLKG